MSEKSWFCVFLCIFRASILVWLALGSFVVLVVVLMVVFYRYLKLGLVLCCVGVGVSLLS